MSEQSIFLSALEYAGPERASFLDRACANNANLRRQVEELLTAHERSGEFLDQPAVAQIAAKTPPVDQSTRTLNTDANSTPGDRTVAGPNSGDSSLLGFLKPPTRSGSIGRLDHYEILEHIGAGGFGSVYRAFDDRLHRVVAVKVLASAFAANGSARRRFIREARTAAAVKNEHVVGIYDVEEDAQPPYLAMEMIDGISLQDKIDKTGPLGVKEILRIGLQTAEGLAAAHKQGLVHRDIKPSNILLENGVERVKITDFGLARAVDDASVTQSGTVAGTPMYMSPEQAEGQAVDHRSDLFSLGTVMYAMCAGHSPFRASGTHAVLRRVIEETPRPIREINDEIPEWLGEIICKLHAKKPGERFQTAKEVAELLQQHLAHLQEPGQVAKPAPLRVAVTVNAAGQMRQPPSPWRPTMAGCIFGAVFGLICGAIDADAMRVSGRNTPLWLNGAYFAAIGAAIGVLIGFLRTLFFARIAWEIRNHKSGAPIARVHAGLFRRIATAVALLVFSGVCIVFVVLMRRYDPPTLLRVLRDQGRLTVEQNANIERINIYKNGNLVGLLDADGIDVPAGDFEMEIISRPGFRPASIDIEVQEPNNRYHDRVAQPELERYNLSLRRACIQTFHISMEPVNTLEPVPDDGKNWVRLFNGANLTGWKTHPDQPGNWKASGGAIAAVGPSSSLFTERGDYTNFRLRAQVKVNTEGLFGIGFHTEYGFSASRDWGSNTPVGYEVEIGPARGSLVERHPGSTVNTPLNISVKPGEWFTVELIAEGGQVALKVDGAKVLDIEFRGIGENAPPGGQVPAASVLHRDKVFTKGHISLRTHLDNHTWVEFRNIEVKELSPSPPPVPTTAAEVLPFIRGTWKRDASIVEPKLPADKARSFGQLTFDTVAGGNVMRGLTVDENGRATSLMLHSFDSKSGRLQSWYVSREGDANSSSAGVFYPTTRTFEWSEGLPDGTHSVHNLEFVDANTVRARNFDTNAKNNIIYESHATFTRVSQPPVIPKDAIDPKRPAEMKILDRLVGEWRNEITVSVAGPDTKTETVRVKAESILGGRLIEKFETNESTGKSDYTLSWFDTDAKKYRTWFFNQTGTVTEFTGTWNEAAKTITWKSMDGLLEGHWIVKGDNQYDFRRIVKDKDGKVLGEATSVAHRAGAGRHGSDRERLQGKWRVISGEREGRPMTVAELKDFDWIIFSGEQQSWNWRDKVFKGTYRLNTSSNPKQLDFVFDGSKTNTMIYTFEGDTLVIADDGGVVERPRPNSFKTTSTTTFNVQRFRRETPEGYVPLFNGQDLTGWKTHDGQPIGWRVVGDILVGTGSERYLFTERSDYRDFHLKVEAKISDQGNSGVHFRSQMAPKIPPGYEAQINIGGDRWKTGSLFVLPWNIDTSVLHFQVDPLIKVDEWFTLEILARGPKISVSINNKPVTEISDRQYESGHIALQAGRAKTEIVQFRKIEIKELPQSIRLPDTPEQVLPALAGNWKGEFTQKIYGGKTAEKKFSAVAVNDWVLGGKWLRQRVHMEDGGFVSLTSFEPNSKSFREWYYHARGLIFGPSAGRWDPATRTMTWTNLPDNGTVLLTTWRFIDADTVTSEILIRNKDGKNLFEMSSRMKRINEAVSIDETTSAGPLPPEMAVLDRLVGDWQTTALIKSSANPAGAKASWNDCMRRILGGRFIATTDGGPGRQNDDIVLATYDTFAKKYGRWWFKSDGTVLEYYGDWDEKAQTMKLLSSGSDGSQSSNTWQFREANHVDWLIVAKDGAGKTNHEVQATSTRKTVPTKRTILEFDGRESRVEIPGVGLEKNAPFTIEAWVSEAAEQLSKDAVLVNIVQPERVAWLRKTGRSWIGINWLVGDKTLNGGAPLSTAEGKLSHLAATWDGKSMRLFLDGVPVKSVQENQSDASGWIAPTSSMLVIGASVAPVKGMPAFHNYFKGRIGGVHISNVVRYDKDFKPATRFVPDKNTVALFHFDEGQGDKVTDSSGNGRHGKIVGAKWANVDGPPSELDKSRKGPPTTLPDSEKGPPGREVPAKK